MSACYHCFSLTVWKHLLLILIRGIYTCVLKQSRPPLGAVRQGVLTASRSAWYVRKIIENSCGPEAVQVAERLC